MVPAVNQIEVHPYFTQPDVQKADAEHGILTQAWSPIGGITFYPGFGDDRVSVLDDPLLREHRGRSRQDAGTGDAALAPPGGPLRDPEVDQPGPDRGELRRVRLRAVGRRASRIDALDRGVRNGPDPDVPRPAFFDRVIPEA